MKQDCGKSFTAVAAVRDLAAGERRRPRRVYLLNTATVKVININKSS